MKTIIIRPETIYIRCTLFSYMAKTSDYVQLYMTPEGPKIIESSTKTKILSLLEMKDLYFDEILAKTGKSKPTLSNHLKILEDRGIIGSKSDPYDKRKKQFYIKAKQYVELSTEIKSNIDLKDYFKKSLTQIDNPVDFYALTLRSIRFFLIDSGIDIDPLLYNIGTYMGESTYDYIKSPKTEELVENMANFFNKFELGQIKLTENDPLTIHIDENFECKDMINIGRSHCAIAKGAFESIFSMHFQSEVLVDEVKCHAKGDEYCSFVIKKLDKKISLPVRGAIEFI